MSGRTSSLSVSTMAFPRLAIAHGRPSSTLWMAWASGALPMASISCRGRHQDSLPSSLTKGKRGRFGCMKVTRNWGIAGHGVPYALVPFAAVDHLIGKYTKYLDRKSAEDGPSFYVSSFEKLDDDDHGGDSDGDDEVPPSIPRPDLLDDDGDDDVWAPDYELSVEQQVGIINL